jgi:hypothetical protein
MAAHPYSWRGIRNAAITGLIIIAIACGFQWAFLPTVRVTCPARTAAAPDCELRWLVAFDTITVRRVPLPALESVSEIEQTTPTKKGGATTMYLNTAAGRVRAITWGDHMSLQTDLRDPIRAYLGDAHAPAREFTMWSSRWVDPGGDADYRLVRKAHPARIAANVLVCVGLFFWIWLPVQIVKVLTGGSREPTPERRSA